MEAMKEDLIEVLERYVDVDSNKIEMEINREEQMMAMIANFPIKRS